MTREMIKQIERDYWAEKADPIDMAEIFDLAIKALEQELNTNNGDWAMQESMDDIRALPSVTPQLSSGLEKNSKKLEKDFGELDCISREQAIEGVWEIELAGLDNKKVVDMLKALPSVTPQEPKTGHWISTETKGVRYAFWCRYKCSLCGGLSDRTNFCPNCGARMVEPQESEDKE